ncbi:MAG TPA: hypothetical protein VN203_11515 [Candidatus Acidoferrum sp.]|nr:hypothetical protein [Candidatus Acidoferrum sp.]
MTDELLRLVKFDRNELRSAILKCEQATETLLKQRTEIVELASLYRQLLKVHGHETDPGPPPASPTKEEPGKAQARHFGGMKIADAAVLAIREAGGQMHGKRIVQALMAGGLQFGGKNAMDVLRSAMARDERIEKDSAEENTWRLKTGN